MTSDEAATWMVEQLIKRKYLDQEVAAYGLAKLDKSLVYQNNAGNLAVDKKVLQAFRKLMPENVVWSQSERHWRFRQPYDQPGRMQA
jgi:hypothetical protein